MYVDQWGYVRKYEPENRRDPHYSNITRVDLREWKEYWNLAAPHEVIDILDIGFWYYDPKKKRHQYEPPEIDWRNAASCT